jgi:nicotinamide-nucleotide amidase
LKAEKIRASKCHVPSTPSAITVAAELRRLLPGPPPLALAVAESVTCGRMQAAIGAISGASEYFLGGITAYTLAEKVRHLRVDAAEAGSTNSVSAVVAAQMAIGACRLFGSDLAVAATGYAEANPARGFAQPGAYWAVARGGAGNPAVVRQGLFEGPGLERVAMQEAVAAAALGALADYLRIFRVGQRGSRFS